MSQNIQFEGRTYRPNGVQRFKGEEYTDGMHRFFARQGENGMEVFVGQKNWVEHYRPITELEECDIAWFVDESKYDLTGYTLLDL
jgi:hypothetical protein